MAGRSSHLWFLSNGERRGKETLQSCTPFVLTVFECGVGFSVSEEAVMSVPTMGGWGWFRFDARFGSLGSVLGSVDRARRPACIMVGKSWPCMKERLTSVKSNSDHLAVAAILNMNDSKRHQKSCIDNGYYFCGFWSNLMDLRDIVVRVRLTHMGSNIIALLPSSASGNNNIRMLSAAPHPHNELHSLKPEMWRFKIKWTHFNTVWSNQRRFRLCSYF